MSTYRKMCKTCLRVYSGRGRIRWYHTAKTWHIAPRNSGRSLCGREFPLDKRGKGGLRMKAHIIQVEVLKVL
jgi:hypothetical protein